MLTMSDLEALKTLEEYATFQGEVRARMKDLFAEYGVKPFTAEAQAEWAGLDELDKELSARITEKQALRDRIAQIDASKQGEPAYRPAVPQIVKARRVPEDVFALEQYRNLSTSQPEMLQALRDGAMFAVERATYPHPESVSAKEQANIQKLLDTVDKPSKYNPNRELAQLILSTGSPLYERAFTKYIQGKPLSPEEQRAAAAPLTVQTDPTGGYAVPFYFDPTLLHVGAWTNVNPYRQTCTVKTIVGSDTYHGATVGAFTVARAAEATAAEQGMQDDSFGQISAIVAKVQGTAAMSIELLSDRSDITSELASLISEAKDTEEETAFSNGSGAALGGGFQPIGMFGAAHDTTGAYTHIDTAAAAGAVAKEDAYSMESALPIRHRANAAWFMNRGVIRVFQALETSGGQLFGGVQYASVGYPQNSPAGNTGLRLLNYPIWETPSAPAFVAATDDLVIAALVNPKTFYIVERAGMTVEVVQHMFDGDGKLTGQRGIYAWWRNTAKPATVDGGRRLALLA